MKIAKNICVIAIIIITFGIGIGIYNSVYAKLNNKNESYSDYNSQQGTTNANMNENISNNSDNNKKEENTSTNNITTNRNTNNNVTTNSNRNTTTGTNNNQNTTTTSETKTGDNANKTETESETTQKEETKELIEHKVHFYINGKLEEVKCSSEEQKCRIKAPTINLANYEAVGWATKSNSKEIDVKLSNYYIVSNDITLYLVSRKKIDNLFITLDEAGTTVDTEMKSCYQYNTEKDCYITAPSFKRVENTETTGWSLDKNITTIDLKENETKAVTTANTYYAIRKSINQKEETDEKDTDTNDNEDTNNTTDDKVIKTVTAKFIIQDSKAASVNETEKKCDIHTGETSCEINVPIMTAKANSTIIGWNTNKTATKKAVDNGGKIKINSNVTYYSITTRQITITFDKNKSFNYNTVSRTSEGYNYSKENIEAEKLSFYTTTCISYNGKGCTINKIPVIYSTGNELRGYSTKEDGSPINPYQKVFTDDTTLYARVYNNANRATLNTYYYTTLGNVPVELDKNMSKESVTAYTTYLTKLYKEMPELFYMNGKLTLLLQPTYASVVQGSSAGISGGTVPNVLINIPTDKVIEIGRVSTIVHELGHAFGKYYQTRTNVASETDSRVLKLFNKYKDLSIKPMREYSYVHVNEFYADMFRYYYLSINPELKIEKPNDKYTETTTNEINSLVNKLRCIARNNYNENATQCS